MASEDIEARVHNLWQWLCVDSLLYAEDGDNSGIPSVAVQMRRAVSASCAVTQTPCQVGHDNEYVW